MFVRGNLGLVKKINKRTVLNLIRDQKMISRAEIAKVAGLNKATVSALVDELIQENFVFESGIGASTGGRRPTMLKFNHLAGSIVGAELGVNYIYTVLTDLNANILWEKRIELGEDTKQEEILQQMVHMIQEALENAPETPNGVMGIGIGVPGIVNSEQGKILFAPNLRWDNVAFLPFLKEHLPNYMITIENEAKLAALGEKWFGASRSFSNLVYISAGTGIGAGIIINNQLYSGTEGQAGEIGHHIIQANGLTCSCGNNGCWEMYASEKAIRRRLIEINRKEEADDFSIDRLCSMAESGDREIAEIFQEIGTYLGIGLLNVVHAYNPEAIIIGNTLGRAGKWLLQHAEKIVNEKKLTKSSPNPVVVNSELKEKSCVIGAVSSILDKILNPVEINVSEEEVF